MEDFYDKIEAYIAGSLDANERSDMDAAMQSDEELRLAVENYPTASKISGSLLELDVLGKLEELDAENENTDKKEDTPMDKKSGKNNKKVAKVILIIAILLMLYTLFRKGQRDGSQDKIPENQIYAMGYERPIDPDAVKSVNPMETKNNFARGKQLFALNRYAEAEQAFKNGLLSTTDSDTLSMTYYWLTHAHMNQEEWDEAKMMVEKTKENGANKLREILASVR